VLVRVGLDSDGVAELALRDSIETRASQRLLLLHLVQGALLIYAGTRDRDALLKIVKTLPQELRKIWAACIGDIASATPAGFIARSLAEMSDPHDLLEWAGEISLALVGTRQAERLNLASNRARLLDGGSNIEVTRIAAVDSMRLRDALTTQRTDIAQAQGRDEIWMERFHVAASTPMPITILDRWAVETLAEALADGSHKGLGWFLEKIATESSAPVHLITCAKGKSDAGRVVADLSRLGQRLSGGGIQTLSVTLAASRHFVQQSHPRHARFGRVAIGLERGLSMFDDSHCPHSMPCNLVDRATAREREERIEREAFPGFRRQVVW
jgi:hypothetical protein